MTKDKWEDICISFDEYGMQPATLCENEEAIIQSFRKAFKEVLQDLEKYEKIKKMLYNAYIYNEEEYIVFIEVLNNGD